MGADAVVNDWTFGPWPFDATTAMLTLHSGHRPTLGIDDDTVDEWRAVVRAGDHQRVRTNAIGPWLADRLLDLGFVVKQELDLLERNRPLAHEDQGTANKSRGWRIGAIRTRRAVHIDVASFGDEWALDDAGLHHAIRATREFRLRGVSARRSIGLGPNIGYCLAGVTDGIGYIQRLAVLPSARRGGAASALLDDALRWACERGANLFYVNTDVDNDAALSLYRQWGFESVGYHLRVLECDRSTFLSGSTPPGDPQ